MLKLTRNGIGALNAQYRSVLRKCAILNVLAAGLVSFMPTANAEVYDSATYWRLEYMGTEIKDGNSIYVHGSGGYNIKEVINEGRIINNNSQNNSQEQENDTDNDAWIRNRSSAYFGYNTSGTTVNSTVVEEKHNTTVLNGYFENGGGVLSNMNNDDDNTVLNIYLTEFNNNSATRFVNELGIKESSEGVAAGGAISNYSANQASIVRTSFNDNYVMHFYNAAGGAIYNASKILYRASGPDPISGSIQSTGGGTFVNNHAGNEMLDNEFITTKVRSKIIDFWKNNSSDTVKGDLTSLAYGGAIYNSGIYLSNNDRFEYNHAIGVTSFGGAIYNNKYRASSTIAPFGGEINLNGISTFVGNYVGEGKAADGSTVYGTVSSGGAIYNDGTLNIAAGDNNNMIYFGNDTSTSGSHGNYAIASGTAAGGAIYNGSNGSIDAIRYNSLFTDNYVKGISSGNALGGAIANYGSIAMQGGTYESNRAEVAGGMALGGAIYNGSTGTITLEISHNSAFNGNKAGYGGAIYNAGTIDGSINSNAVLEFAGNTASVTSGGMAMGNSVYNATGASFNVQLTGNAQIHFAYNQNVYNAGNLFKISGSNTVPTELTSSQVATMTADNTSVLLDTTLYSASNSAVYNINRTNLILSSSGYIDSTVINSSAVNDTALNLANNTITLQDGSYMNLNSANDTLSNNDFSLANNTNLRYKNQNGNTSYLANTITNSGTVTYYGYADDTDMYVAKALVNSNVLDAASDKLLTNIHIDNLKSKSGSQIVVNLNNSAANPSASKADIIVIDSTIHNDSGSPTKVVFNDMNNNLISQVYLGEDDKIYFAKTQVSQTDYDFANTFVTTATNNDYEIKIGYENNGSVYDWFLYRDATPPPPPVDPALDPEDMALINLPRAALEQTRSILLPISRTNRGQCSCYKDNCDKSFCRYESATSKTRLWATPIYRKGSYDKPIETDFTVKGIDFGIDVQPTHSDMLGIFGSYRSGKYENDGKGKKYFSHFGNELDITSILGGLYYRKYFGNTYMLGAVYGGKLDVDLKTKTGVKGSVDGSTIGAQLGLGHDIRLTHREILTPSLTATYNYIKFKEAKDVNGKKATFGNVNNVELEAALKYEYQFNNEYQLPTTGYIKPSIIQTIASGGKVKIDDKEYTDTLENETLGRIEVGADAEIIKNFSIGAFGNYTFGSEYSAWGIGGNVRYVW